MNVTLAEDEKLLERDGREKKTKRDDENDE